MELVIKGNDNRVKRLVKELKLRLKRDKLEYSLIDGKKPEAKQENSKAKEHHNTVIGKIKEATSLDELDQFKNDDRKSVKSALKAKVLELTKDE